jgi:tetratricopeptide (TPR) repeat protein
LSTVWNSLVEAVKDKWDKMPEPSLPQYWPQFELLMDELNEVRQGFAIQLLRPYKRILPNRNHELLASIGETGCPLVTTNFDVNVEHVLSRRGASVSSLASVQDCMARPHERKREVRLLKLHGCITRPRTVVCSFRDLARRGTQASMVSLSVHRFHALRDFLRGRTCFVVGYSASDKLDIDPCLKQLRETRFVLIQHSQPCRFPGIERMINIPSRRHLNGRSWATLDLTADTTQFLGALAGWLGFDISENPQPLEPPEATDDDHIKKTCALLTPEEALISLVRILHASGDSAQSVRFLEHALRPRIPARVRFTIEENLIRLHRHGADEVSALKKLKKRIRRPIAPWISARLEYDIAYALDSQGRYDLAIAHAKTAIRAAERADERYLLLETRLLYCLCLARNLHHGQALRRFSELLPVLKRFGNGRYLAEAHNGIACLLADKGNYPAALENIRRAKQLWGFSGDQRQHLSANLNEANILFHQERLPEGRASISIVLGTCNENHRLGDVLAHALLLQGHDKCARRGLWKEGLSDLARSITLQSRTAEGIHLLPNTLTTLQLLRGHLEKSAGDDSAFLSLHRTLCRLIKRTERFKRMRLRS